ncbi:MAG: DNA-binding transcriptional regulator GbsR (MarR family) [Myxococcota bacterium]|jgi:DNA-binding transcriptional regulator GbsR (MarR family)
MSTSLGRPWGSTAPTPSPPSLASWEVKVIEAVGGVIAFWGFKHNHGRIWALLYLRNAALTAADLQDNLDLSKGAVSMLTRDLENLGIVDRIIDPDSGTRRYAANTELTAMISSMIQRREAGVIRQARTTLAEAEADARSSGAAPDVVERIKRMRQLADVMEQALMVFLGTTQLDFRSFLESIRLAMRLRRGGQRNE